MFILDSDIISYYLKGQFVSIKDNLHTCLKDGDTLFITVISHYEIMRGLIRKRATKLMTLYQSFQANCSMLHLTPEAAEIAALEHAYLARSGLILADNDLLIAAIALANDYALVSNNQKHFNRIRNIRLANWL